MPRLRWGTRRGANAVEFALSLPILMMILSATVDYGWYFQQQTAVINATAQGVKAAANDTSADPLSVGLAVASDVWTATGYPSRMVFTAEYDGVAPHQLVWVQGDGDYTPLIGFVGNMGEYRVGVVSPSGFSYRAYFRVADQ